MFPGPVHRRVAGRVVPSSSGRLGSVAGVDDVSGAGVGRGAGAVTGGRAAGGDTPCAWCGRPVGSDTGTGRRRRYCRHSCRQRAYEQRRSLRATELPEGSVVLTEAEAADLMDRMFQVRCSCEDLATAVAEGADADELAALATELVHTARAAERLR